VAILPRNECLTKSFKVHAHITRNSVVRTCSGPISLDKHDYQPSLYTCSTKLPVGFADILLGSINYTTEVNPLDLGPDLSC